MRYWSVGIFLICGLFQGVSANSGQSLSAQEWAWECIPSVVKDDGEPFLLTIEVGSGDVQSLTVTVTNNLFAGLGNGTFGLTDDGVFPDQVANDGVYTAGPWELSPTYQIPDFYNDGIEGVSGADFVPLGEVELTTAAGTSIRFVNPPSVGALDAAIPTVAFSQLNGTVRTTKNLVNVRYIGRNTQRALRGTGGDARFVTQFAYQKLPDIYDFFHLFSVDHVERLGFSSSNFTVGDHMRARTDATGIGLAANNSTAFFGSNGRLLGITLLDTAHRGVNSANLTRQMLRQWGYYGNLLGRDGEYFSYSSAGSLLGGYEWFEDFAGNLVRDCTEGEKGAFFASDIDLYLMGLLGASELPDQYSHAGPVLLRCGQTITDPYDTFTPAQIAADLGGPRVPGTNTAQRAFQMGFVAESCIRWLTPTELTFYDLLAAEVASDVDDFTPYVSNSSWVRLTDFFGDDVDWSTTIPPILSPLSNDGAVLTLEASNLQSASSYSVEAGTSLAPGDWTRILGPTPVPAGAIDVFNVPMNGPRRFFRIQQ